MWLDYYKITKQNIYIHISPADEAERRREERNQQQRKRRNEMTDEQREEMNRKRREQRAMKKVQPDNLNDWLCNGTRLMVRALQYNTIDVEIVGG